MAITFNEDGSDSLRDWFDSFDGLMSSDLTQAEVRSACHRERTRWDAELFKDINWLLPTRTLDDEITRVLDAGYLTGADLWHLATALYYAADPSDVGFLTLDIRQRNVAKALGFRVE